MEQQAFGTVVGATSLLVGYLLHQHSQTRSKELSYLQHVVQFTNLKKLREYLAGCPDQKADVLIEGTIKSVKGSETLKSEKSGAEGVAKYVTTTTYTKVYHQKSTKWNEASDTIENLRVSVPFHLGDSNGNVVTVQSVHNAGGFRQILERVWQDRVTPLPRSMGDYATNVTLSEIPNGHHIREYLLLFGTSMGAYGTATLKGNSFMSSGSVTLTPFEVSSSIERLISRNEVIVSTLKFFATVFVIGGVGILIMNGVPLLMRLLGNREETNDQEQ